jgi:tyrosinase
VVRSPGTPADLATIASNVSAVEADTTFAAFTSGLEAIHGAVHVWVGGNMGYIPTAPSDPIFWMHHANVDRLWWQWQQAHPGLNPTLTEHSGVSERAVHGFRTGGVGGRVAADARGVCPRSSPP